MPVDSNNKWIIRSATGADIPFIYATWLNSYRTDSNIGSTCRKSVYFTSYARVIDHILSQEETLVKVAVLPDTTDVILGYAVYEPKIIHYVFVKDAFRRNGVAKSLIDPIFPKPREYSHRTGCIAPYLAQVDSLTYQPFSLFKQTENKEGEQLNGKVRH